MGALVDPVLLTIVALAAGLFIFTKSRRYGLSLLIIGSLFIYALSTPFASSLLLDAAEAGPEPVSAAPRSPQLAETQATEPQAIVILGGDIRSQTLDFGGDTVGRLSLERIRYGARVHRQVGLPVLTTGGLIGDTETPIAAAMADALREDYRVPVKWVEGRSRNTFENALRSAEILSAEGISTVYLVTHSWHMPRAVEAFRHVGLDVIPRPTGLSASSRGRSWRDFIPNSGSLGTSAFAIHERVGRIWYRIRYY